MGKDLLERGVCGKGSPGEEGCGKGSPGEEGYVALPSLWDRGAVAVLGQCGAATGAVSHAASRVRHSYFGLCLPIKIANAEPGCPEAAAVLSSRLPLRRAPG